jgi:hypothetical protein
VWHAHVVPEAVCKLVINSVVQGSLLLAIAGQRDPLVTTDCNSRWVGLVSITHPISVECRESQHSLFIHGSNTHPRTDAVLSSTAEVGAISRNPANHCGSNCMLSKHSTDGESCKDGPLLADKTGG